MSIDWPVLAVIIPLGVVAAVLYVEYHDNE
jgi:hypothetical protein